MRGDGEPLGGTEEREILADNTLVPRKLRVARELWLLRCDRLCR